MLMMVLMVMDFYMQMMMVNSIKMVTDDNFVAYKHFNTIFALVVLLTGRIVDVIERSAKMLLCCIACHPFFTTLNQQITHEEKLSTQ